MGAHIPPSRLLKPHHLSIRAKLDGCILGKNTKVGSKAMLTRCATQAGYEVAEGGSTVLAWMPVINSPVSQPTSRTKIWNPQTGMEIWTRMKSRLLQYDTLSRSYRHLIPQSLSEARTASASARIATPSSFATSSSLLRLLSSLLALLTLAPLSPTTGTSHLQI